MKRIPKVRVKFASPSSQLENSQNASFQDPSGTYGDFECSVSIETKIYIPRGVYAKGPRFTANYARKKIQTGKFSATVIAGAENDKDE